MKIVKIENLLETRFLNFMQTTYEDMKGVVRKWFWVKRPGNEVSAVVIVPLIKGEQGHDIVITKEFRVVLQDYEWGFPAGLIEGTENLEETVRRELKEETGLDLVNIFKVSPPIYSSIGLSDESVYVCFAVVSGQISNQGNESSEDITAQILTRKEVKKLLLGNKKFGAKAWLILDHFASNGTV